VGPPPRGGGPQAPTGTRTGPAGVSAASRLGARRTERARASLQYVADWHSGTRCCCTPREEGSPEQPATKVLIDAGLFNRVGL